MTLVDFLRARLDEDEAAARAARKYTDRDWDASGDSVYADHAEPVVQAYVNLPQVYEGVVAHIARHDPARVLADVKAKRAIVRECVGHETCGGGYDECSEAALVTLRHFASVYADHPDYDATWAP
jgi:hypothetical protein